MRSRSGTGMFGGHQSARRAVARIDEFKPYKLRAPTRLDLRFKNYRPSEVLAYLPVIERTDSHSIRFAGKDILEVSRFLQFIDEFESDLQP